MAVFGDVAIEASAWATSATAFGGLLIGHQLSRSTEIEARQHHLEGTDVNRERFVAEWKAFIADARADIGLSDRALAKE